MAGFKTITSAAQVLAVHIHVVPPRQCCTHRSQASINSRGAVAETAGQRRISGAVKPDRTGKGQYPKFKGQAQGLRRQPRQVSRLRWANHLSSQNATDYKT
ncbi:unnamed protein product [Pieris macdunnoughi]|uniref:Uncharacterized protein n=1 Tax=Pieris macdunnoughi TaxID=345717 RepID=A0A821W2Q6_9NEOP|nr:unnamed protein product [Pieris macdunnoughi]